MKIASKTFPLTSIAVDSKTAKVYPSAYDMFTVGAGYLDIQAALYNRDGAYGSALSPVAYWNSLVSTAMLFRSSSSTWDNNIWSLSNVWGPQVVQSTIGGTSAAGARQPPGQLRRMGTSAAWETSAAWGAHNGIGEN